jgi:hypothetical protein
MEYYSYSCKSIKIYLLSQEGNPGRWHVCLGDFCPRPVPSEEQIEDANALSPTSTVPSTRVPEG